VDDLSREALGAALPGRELRTYPAMLSTEADALAWARSGGPGGALVVADYQASPRGRGGLPWTVRPGVGLGFSLVCRPDLPPEREGWLYTVATCALADLLEGLGHEPVIEWPDEVHVGGTRAAAVGSYAELGPQRIAWAVLTVLIENAEPPRTRLLADAVDAIERRAAQTDDEVLADHVARCATVGREVRARLVPLGPSSPEIAGRAVDGRADGSLAIETGPGRRIAVPPQQLGRLEMS
jgi:BirA family transcriptional regulator, biotin operon repressor / biotin---[acetyl-CoA-carboxylase] ligase